MASAREVAKALRDFIDIEEFTDVGE